MTVIKSSGELMEKVCAALGAGAFGEGSISVLPKEGSEYIKLYGGGIIKIRAVVSAEGSCGKEELISRLDSAVKKAEKAKGGGIILISSPFPTVIAKADSSGFARLERSIDIIYSGVVA